MICLSVSFLLFDDKESRNSRSNNYDSNNDPQPGEASAVFNGSGSIGHFLRGIGGNGGLFGGFLGDIRLFGGFLGDIGFFGRIGLLGRYVGRIEFKGVDSAGGSVNAEYGYVGYSDKAVVGGAEQSGKILVGDIAGVFACKKVIGPASILSEIRVLI